MTPLSGKSQDFHKDSVTCYTKDELRAIALQLIKGEKSIEDLRLDNLQIIELQTMVVDLKFNEADLKQTLVFKDTIQAKTQRDLDTKTLQYNKQVTKTKWIKAGWLTTTLILSALIGYQILTH